MKKLFLSIVLSLAFCTIATAQMNMAEVTAHLVDHTARIIVVEAGIVTNAAAIEDASDGSTTMTSLVLPSISRTIWNLAGAPQALTIGTDVACDDGDRHFTEIMVPYTTTATGIFYLIGSVGGTDSVVVELFDVNGDLVTGATSVASATAAGDIVGTAATFQAIPFTDGPITVTPGLYYVSAQFDGTTAKYRAPLTTGVPYGAATESGTAWTPASITPDSTWTVSEGIIGGIY